MTAAPPSKASRPAAVATNRKARHEYVVLETLEAGIALLGTEVKSVRGGHVSLAEAFGRVEKGEVWIEGLHIQPYAFGNVHNHDPRRPRKLLLHRSEIRRLFGQIAVKGQALVPLRMYFKHGRVKLELAICRGKHVVDKRETIKRRTADREAARAIAAHRRR